MPVILGAEIYDLLDPGFRDIAPAAELLKAFNDKSMRRYKVSERVNNVANDDPECSEPFSLPPPIQAGLF
jgi:putative SOS response-associated peptidase YedK